MARQFNVPTTPRGLTSGFLRFVCMLLVGVSAVVWSLAAQAEPVMPVAFRTWSDQTVSIETYWGLQVSLGPGASQVEPDLTLGGASLAVRLPSGLQATRMKWDKQTSLGELAVGRDQEDSSLSVALDRAPNRAKASLVEMKPGSKPTQNAVLVKSWYPKIDGAFASTPVARVQAAEVVLIYGTHTSLEAAADNGLGKNVAVDLAVVVLDGVAAIDAKDVKALAKKLGARQIYLIGDAQVTGEMATRKAVGNTTALVAGAKPHDAGPVLIQHADKPWEMPEAMGGLFADLDAAGRKWSAVFEPLSVNQMNHQPANGTHTPRWNIEHMASRQMFFITRLYHAADPSFPHVRLDPAQMPPNYKARHADWDGAEEARRVYRTSAFVQRFAYLYHGRDLDQPLAGTRIRFRAIVRQVTRHYPEHTRNVLDKMKLDDWPAE